MEIYKIVMLALLLVLVCPSGGALIWTLWRDCREAKRRRKAAEKTGEEQKALDDKT